MHLTTIINHFQFKFNLGNFTVIAKTRFTTVATNSTLLHYFGFHRKYY